MDQIVRAPIVSRHRGERLPIDTLFINTQAAPSAVVLKDLVRQLIDAGTGLARPVSPVISQPRQN